MRVTRTVKICYLAGIVLVIVGVYYIQLGISRLDWEYPDHTTWGLTCEQYTQEMKDLSKIIIYPYRDMGITILLYAVTVFILMPSIVSQIIHETKTS